MSTTHLTPILGICVATAVAVAAGPAGAGTAYYVNGSCGNNTWTGTSPVCSAPDGPKAAIQAGIAAAVDDGDEVIVADGVYTGGGNRNLNFVGRLITVRSANGPDNCIIDCQGFGRAFDLQSGETLEAVIQGFTITNASAYLGAGVLALPASATVIDCVFESNSAGHAGGAIYQDTQDGTGGLALVNCAFNGNYAEDAGGAVLAYGSSFTATGCVFVNNDTVLGAGAIGYLVDVADVVDCLFADNDGGSLGGGIVDGAASSRIVNCAFSRNRASVRGAGVVTGSLTSIINCTFSGNVGYGVTTSGADIFANCILWGSTVGEIDGPAVVSFSNIQGGWPGTGNIDEDPLFVQPGTDNVRLSIGSPCVNAGDNDAIPPDITTDIDGNPRIIGGVVDMGAYEGEFDQEAAAAGDSDFDNGEFVVLVPTGGPPDPLESAVVFVVNTSGPDDATFVVTEYEGDMYPEAAGYSELSCILSLDTSLADGQYLATLLIPFAASGFGAIDPVGVNLTRYDPVAGNWALAVTGNTANSPGFDGPVGNRVLSLEGGAWGVTSDLGDYGVYWDPSVQLGFAWANVDVAEDFGLGVALCPADCRQTPDGEVAAVRATSIPMG
jgi:predicted outer membrane repeat protein